MSNKFQLIIGADGKEVTQTLGELKRDYKQFSKDLQNAKGGQAIAELNKKLADTQANMAAIKRFNLGGTLANIKPGANQATQGLTDVSRVIQDLPYGITGVGNNINPLIESFGRIKKETGSAGAALKAMAGSLVGVGGVGLAIAAVTSAITIYQNGILGFNKKTKEAKEKTDSLKDSLKSVGEITQESIAKVQGQVASMREFAKAATDANLSLKERKRAMDELIKIDGGYFKFLEDGKTTYAELTTAVDKYTEALIKQAAVKGLESQISKLAGDLVEAKFAMSELADQYKAARLASDKLNGPMEKNSAGFSVIPKNIKDLREQASTVDDVRDKLDEQGQTVDLLTKKYSSFQAAIKSATAELLNTEQIQIGSKGENKTKSALEQQIENLEKLKEQIGLKFSQEELLIDLKAKFFIDQNKWLSDLQKQIVQQGAIFQKDNLVKFDLPVKINTNPVLGKFSPADTLGSGINPNYSEGMTRVLEQSGQAAAGLAQLQARMQNLQSFMNEFVTPAFDSFFSSVISGTQSFGEAFRNMFKQLIQQIIATIAKAAALAAIMSAFGGGSFMSLFKGNLSGGGLGGLFGGGGSPSVGGGSFAGSALGAVNVVVSGQLSGQDILLSGQRAAGRSGRLGG